MWGYKVCCCTLMDSALSLSLQVLKGCKTLHISVCSMGPTPGGYITNNLYSWVDPQGRSVSPPPDSQEDSQRHGMEERAVRTKWKCVLVVKYGGPAERSMQTLETVVTGNKDAARVLWKQHLSDSELFIIKDLSPGFYNCPPASDSSQLGTAGYSSKVLMTFVTDSLKDRLILK